MSILALSLYSQECLRRRTNTVKFHPMMCGTFCDNKLTLPAWTKFFSGLECAVFENPKELVINVNSECLKGCQGFLKIENCGIDYPIFFIKNRYLVKTSNCKIKTPYRDKFVKKYPDTDPFLYYKQNHDKLVKRGVPNIGDVLDNLQKQPISLVVENLCKEILKN